jgi:hypothetical protein
VLDKMEGASFVKGFHSEEPTLGKIRVRTANGDEEIEVGRTFIRRLMDGVTLSASETLTTAILPRKTLLRSPRIFPESLDASEISQVTLDCGALQVFERDPKNPRAFTMLVPPGFAVDEAGLHGFTENLTRLRGEAWVADEDRGAWKTKTSSCKVSFRTKDEAGSTTHSLILGSSGQGGYFARVDEDPAVAVVPTSVSDLMHAIYIDTDLPRPSGSLTSVQVKRDGKTTTLKQGDESREAFAQLEGLSFDSVLHLGPPQPEDALTNPSLDLTLIYATDAGTTSTTHLTLGAKSPKGITAMAEGASAVFLLNPRKLSAFLPEPSPPQGPRDAAAERD